MKNRLRYLDFDAPKPLSNDVKALINNGLEFLDKAREELQSSKPKFSIVSFWTAVEILLKVPLAHEHWTLVCSPKKTIKKQDYHAGNFHSLTYEETCSRLQEVLEKPLPKTTAAIFNKIRQHRNRVVHFYHPSFTDADQKTILSEQADAWFALNRLMRDDWASLFGEQLDSKLAADEERMLENNYFYIEAKFRYIQPTLDDLRKHGYSIGTCASCKQAAAVDTPFNEESGHTFHETTCLVCGVSAPPYMEVSCPECQIRQRLENNGDSEFSCVECDYSVSRYKLLDEWDGKPEDLCFSGLPANCSECDGYGVVCEYGGEYLCTVCLVRHESLECCEYCGSHSTSVPEMSGLMGCNFCDGNYKLLND